MSASKPTTARLKPGSAFKVPGSRKASTPRVTDDKNSTLSCNLSAIPPASTGNHRARPRPLPGAKASTPTKDEKEVTLSCDISAIRPGSVVAQQGNHAGAPNVKKALYKQPKFETSVQVPSNKMSKQMELDMAYNTYLLAVTHNTIQEKHYADTKAQIEADLDALSKRLAVNQLNLENTKQRIAKISFLSEQDGLLRAQRDALSATLDHVEGAVGQKISDISSAVDAKADNLEMRNIATGTAELKKILADSNRILNQLKASNPSGDGCDEMSTAADHIKSTAATLELVNARRERVAKKLPAYRGAPIIEHTIICEAEQREQARRTLEDETDNIGISEDYSHEI